MTITDHIEALLYRYDCVVLPKFGAFLAQRVSAHINTEENTFYPPKKIISFNRQLQENDGLIVNQLAKSDNITYDEAVKKVYEFVQNLNEAIDSGENITIGKVGYFYKEAEKILFQPSYEHNFLLEAFGTSTFTADKIDRTSGIITAESDAFLKNIRVIAEEIALEEQAETPVLLAKNTAAEAIEKSRSNYWKYAAVGVVAIGLGSLLTFGWYSNQVKTHNKIAQQKAEQQIESKIQQATFILDEPLPLYTLKISSPKVEGNYHIVAGAFRDKTNAEKRLKQLKSDGYKAHYIGKNKYNLHQVVYESFENREKALQSLREIRKENQEAWLLVKAL